MDHGFPPLDRLWDASKPGLVLAHGILLLVVIAIGWGVVVAVRKPPSKQLVNRWGRGLLVAFVVAWYSIIAGPFGDEFPAEVYQTLLMGYLGIAVLEGFVGMVVCDFRFLRLTSTKVGAAMQTAIRGGLRTFFIVSISFLVGGALAELLTVVIHPRRAARRAMCKNNLRQLGLAARAFVEAHAGDWPRSAHGEMPLSWRLDFLPFMDMAVVRQDYDDSRPWDDETNAPLARNRILAFSCPSARQKLDYKKRHFTAYVMVAGPGTIAPGDRVIRNDDIRDGLSNTALFVEAVGLNIVWTEPRDADVSRVPIGVNLKGTGKTDSPGLMSSYHLGGAQMVFADGHARFINQSIDPQVLKSLTTIAGGEPLPPDW